MTMREKMARAAYRHMFPEHPESSWDDTADDYLRGKYLELADTQLDVLMDPSEEMVAQAQAEYEADLNGLGRVIIGCVIAFAIRAAKAGA